MGVFMYLFQVNECWYNMNNEIMEHLIFKRAMATLPEAVQTVMDISIKEGISACVSLSEPVSKTFWFYEYI